MSNKNANYLAAMLKWNIFKKYGITEMGVLHFEADWIFVVDPFPSVTTFFKNRGNNFNYSIVVFL